MSSHQPSSTITFSTLSNKVADLADMWSSRAAYGSLSAAEIFSPDYRRTTAEKSILGADVLQEKARELHNKREDITSAITKANQLADDLLVDTVEHLKKQSSPTEMRKLQVPPLVSRLNDFITKMEEAESSTYKSAEQRPAVLKKSHAHIEAFSGSEIEKETELALLEQREATMSYLFDPACITGSLENNTAMLTKMKALRSLLQDYSRQHQIDLIS